MKTTPALESRFVNLNPPSLGNLRHLTFDFVNCMPMPRILTLDAIECSRKNTNEIHKPELEPRFVNLNRPSLGDFRHLTFDFVGCMPMPRILTLEVIGCNGKNNDQVHNASKQLVPLTSIAHDEREAVGRIPPGKPSLDQR